MAATEMSLGQNANSQAKDTLAWEGNGTYSTTGSGSYDELCYFRVSGCARISVACVEELGQAGSLRIYGQVADTIPTAAAVLTNGTFDQIGTDTAISANEIANTHISSLYSWILVTFAKTSAGAGTNHVTINVLVQ